MRRILALLSLTALLVACGQSDEELKRLGKVEKARNDSLYHAAFKVAVMPTLDCLPLFFAKEKGYFDSLGVDVRLPMYDAQMDCDTAMVGGSVEGSITDLVRAERLVGKGTPLSYEISTNTYWQLVACHRARVKEVSQLSDKIVAITRFSATDRLATMAIEKAKPKNEVYRVQVNSVKVRLDMVWNNLVDAAFLTEPQATAARIGAAQAPADNPVLADSRKMGVHWGVFAFRAKALREKNRKGQLEKFLKAYNRACDSINEYGVRHYADIIKRYCDIDDRAVKALPPLKYPKAQPPKAEDIQKAKQL